MKRNRLERAIEMRNTVIVLCTLLLATTAHAGKRIESCEAAELVPDKGWVYTPYPCPVDADEAAKEKTCGKDYGELRVGMTLKRVEQCLEALAFETETVSKAGKVETYRSTFYWIQARNGRVVSYTRRTY